MLRHSLRLLIVASCLIPSAALASWHIGPNFGISHLSPTNGEASTFVNWGAGSGATLIGMFQPGMRLGWSVGAHADEVYALSGLELISLAGTSAHVFQVSGNYQHAFAEPKADGVFVTVGAGVLSIGGEDDTATVPVLGGGVGFHHFFTEGHGRFRGEVRYDHQGADEDFGLGAADVISLRLGIDLVN